jgi:hypothetical protein
VSALDLDEYRRRAETFIAELDTEYYRHFSGQKETCDTASVYERYPELFTQRGRRRAQRALPDVARRPKRQLAYLRAFATEEYLGRRDPARERRAGQHREPGLDRGRR